jgi:hypothetical protein
MYKRRQTKKQGKGEGVRGWYEGEEPVVKGGDGM